MSTTLTASERDEIFKFLEIFTGRIESEFTKADKRRFVSLKNFVESHIDRYGDDGFGNKDPKMSRVEYWLSHYDEWFV